MLMARGDLVAALTSYRAAFAVSERLRLAYSKCHGSLRRISDEDQGAHL